MEYILQLLLALAQLVVLLAEHTERNQRSANKKISPDDETKISISIKKG